MAVHRLHRHYHRRFPRCLKNRLGLVHLFLLDAEWAVSEL